MVTGFLLFVRLSALAQPASRITILVDAFSQSPTLKQDWGFAALIEYDGKRILFDTGNNADIFAFNTKALNIDLTRLDFVVLSHRHGDHTDGLRHLLKVNPEVRIYVPNDEYFGGPTPMGFFRRKEPTLPAHMRYFNGKVPQQIPHGSPWPQKNMSRIDSSVQINPNITIVRNLSKERLFGETPELSLAIRTTRGQVLVVGCSHPGIEQILSSIGAKENPVRLLVGGLHLVQTPQAELERLAKALREEWNVTSIAPGHCTGEGGFITLQQVFGAQYQYAGLGVQIPLP
ncbi:MBL fold metallo-hydrolase [Nibrella saemangeumensis]|uniref:MBL fold metallo-hydrolase n=1 Tax=Nibrella saemangeumensis TaxID=1084526 RepID=A0ABP8NM37_9BACT